MAVEDRVRVPKAGEIVASHLRRQIILGQLPEGSSLPPEPALMERFGVSRPTLREAFRVLEAEGLITVRRGSKGGARIELPTGNTASRYAGLILQYRGTTLADVYDARTTIETRTVGMMVAKRDRTTLDRLDAALAESKDALDETRRFLATDTRFHLLLVELSGNATLRLFCYMLYRIIEPATLAAHVRISDDVERRQSLERRAFRAHLKLVQLVRAGNAEAAQAFWRRHLIEVGKLLLEDTERHTVLDLLG